MINKKPFKEKCDLCGQWSFYYQGYGNKIICNSCLEKMKNNEHDESDKQESIIEKDEDNEGQMDIFDFI